MIIYIHELCICITETFIFCAFVFSFKVCYFMGAKYKEGTQIQPNCSTRCTCQNGKFYCINQPCLFQGDLCYASGDPHYYTFDQRHYDFQGVCDYIFTQPCNSNEFSIIVTNTANNPYVSSTSSVRVLVPREDLDILLERRGSIKINNQLQPNNDDSIIVQYNDTMVTTVGGHSRIFLTRSAIEVFYDGRSRVTVKASSVWKGMLCGLCGNYNGDPSDDFQTPNGTLATSPDDFGLKWIISKGQEDCGLPEPSPKCSETVMAEGNSRCSVLQQGMFTVCNNTIDPIPYINDCVYDWCYCNEEDKESCVCNSLSNYAAACANNGIVIPDWENSFCSKSKIHNVHT